MVRPAIRSLLSYARVSHLHVLEWVFAMLACLLASLSGATMAAQGRPVVSAVAPIPSTAFVDVTVIPMDQERQLPHQTVVVQGGRITAMGPVAQVRVPADAQRIDGRGKFMVPGLADMHIHLESTDSSGAERVLFLLLANGVTTIRDPDYLHTGGFLLPMIKLGGPDLLRLRARVAAGTVAGPRIYTSGAWRSLGADTAIGQQIAAYQAAGYDFIKVRDESPAIVDSIAAAALQLGIPMLGHVPNGMSVEHAIALHYRSIEHLTGYLPLDGAPRPVDTAADAAFLRQIPQLAAETQRAGVWNCPTLTPSEILTAIPPQTLARWPELRYVPPDVVTRWASQRKQDQTGYRIDLRRRLVQALQRAGAGLLLGTDTPARYLAPYMVPGFTVHHELAALVRAGLTPYQALATGTRNVAAYFGTLNESGTVAVGKQADLVLLTADPLANIQNTTQIAGVMRAGRWFSRAALDSRLAEISQQARLTVPASTATLLQQTAENGQP